MVVEYHRYSKMDRSDYLLGLSLFLFMDWLSLSDQDSLMSAKCSYFPAATSSSS